VPATLPPLPVTLADVRAAAERIRGSVRRTPLIEAPPLPGLGDARVYLKLENLQRTGAFKLRGATNYLALLPPEKAKAGVVAASAGNHAQGVAWAARALGIPATIVMAVNASPLKVSATAALGARVHLHGADYEEAYEEALRLAKEESLTLVHPFDDPAIIAGQGTVGLEILEELPETRRIIAGVGGGGLLSGIAVAARGISEQVKITGIQPVGADTLRAALAQGRVVVGGRPHTFADGLATRHVGELPFRILSALGADAYAVGDLEIAGAVSFLLERAKLLVEGAGATPLAGLLAHPELAQPGPTVLVLSGGNIDPFLLDRVLWIGLSAEGRLLRLRAALADVPGRLAEFLSVAADAGANVRQIEHDRESPAHGPGEVTVELELEVRDPEHARSVEEAYGRRGFRVDRVPAPSAGSASISTPRQA
jgi:threonine dehydratase